MNIQVAVARAFALCLVVTISACGGGGGGGSDSDKDKGDGGGQTPAPSNSAPTAVNDTFEVMQNAGPQDFAVMDNDSDPDGDTLTLQSATAEKGTATVEGDKVRYQPPADFTGSDSITYTISDGELTASATVGITVTAAAVENKPPVAVDDAVSVVAASQNNFIDVLANDSDPEGGSLTIINAIPAEGTASILEGKIYYSAKDGFTGEDTLQYEIQDPEGAKASAVVTITVTEASGMKITVQWTPPKNRENGDALSAQDIAGYEISLKTLPDGRQVARTRVTQASATSAELPVSSGGEYEVRMQTIDSRGIPSRLSDAVKISL